MPAHPHLLQQCHDEAEAGAAAQLGRCLDSAMAVLQSAEEGSRAIAERDRMGLAWRGLAQHRPQWLQAWPGLLKQAQAAGQADQRPKEPPDRSPALSLDTLSLIDSATTDATIESQRLLQSLLLAVDSERAALDGLMSSVLGLDTVRADCNPLRPQVFATALGDLLAASEADAEMRALWLRELAAPLGAELKALYARLVQLLESADVQPAGYRVRLSLDGGVARRKAPPDEAGAGGGTGPGPESGAAGMQSWDAWGDETMPWAEGVPPMSELARPQSGVAREVFHAFLNARGGEFDQPLAAAYFEAVDRQLATMDQEPDSGGGHAAAGAHAQQLSQVRALPVMDRPHRGVGSGTPLDPEAWGALAQPAARTRVLMRLKREASRVGQVMGLEVVRTLVNQVGDDPRLLAPVRESVVALEPALLRLAMAHPRFFHEDQHPARRLVESVAQRSFKFNDEFSSEFASFLGPVQEAFKALNSAGTAEPQDFVNALAGLQSTWSQQDQQEKSSQDDGLHSIRFAEERQTLADAEAWELSKRPDLDGVPAVVLDFLYETWSLVIAHARLDDKAHQIDPGGYRSAVSDLLWSVKKDVTLKRPSRLIDMVPRLVQTLHSGLDLLGKDREESAPFFNALMRLHNPVLKLRRARSRRDAKASASAHLEPVSLSMGLDDELAYASERPVPVASAQPWLARNELDAAGFQDTQPSDHAQLQESDGPVAQAMAEDPVQPEPVEPDAAAVLASLREGAWVDLYSRRQWVRAQLIWASTKGTLFMFVSRGGRPHSMTKRSCERLVLQRLLRPVDAQAVVGRALHAVTAVAARSIHADPAILAEIR